MPIGCSQDLLTMLPWFLQSNLRTPANADTADDYLIGHPLLLAMPPYNRRLPAILVLAPRKSRNSSSLQSSRILLRSLSSIPLSLVHLRQKSRILQTMSTSSLRYLFDLVDDDNKGNEHKACVAEDQACNNEYQVIITNVLPQSTKYSDCLPCEAH